MDLSWAAGTMPATTSLEILWSKASFEGNWLIQPAQLGDIDTGHVASVDPGTGGGADDTTGGDGDGGDPATPIDIDNVETSSAFLAGPGAPDMDSADVVSLFSDDYTSALNGIGSTGWSDGSSTEMDVNGKTVKKFDGVVYTGFDVPVDVSTRKR